MSLREDRPVLGPILAVTYAAPDLGAVEAAYGAFLGYRRLELRRVAYAEAHSWNAPLAEGRPMLVLGPSSGEATVLRFVETRAAAGWRALTSFGWNATEFVVQDVDALAARLEKSPFQIIGPPKGLSRFPMIRAMQVIGPFGECCYFTEVGEGSGLSLATALSFVGRVFIVVAAGPRAEDMFAPYRAFANAHDPPVATPVKVISDAFGLPPETPHPHGLVRLEEGTMIELDGYPQGARPRSTPAGDLAPGMAIVSFSVSTLARLPLIAPPMATRFGDRPGRSACLYGAAGELIELAAPEGADAEAPQ